MTPNRIRSWHGEKQRATGPRTVREFATRLREANRSATGDSLDLAQDALDVLRGRLMRCASQVLYNVSPSSSVGSARRGTGGGSRVPGKVRALEEIRETSERLQDLIRDLEAD